MGFAIEGILDISVTISCWSACSTSAFFKCSLLQSPTNDELVLKDKGEGTYCITC